MLREKGEQTEFSESFMAQFGVGKLELRTQTFETNGQIRTLREITIWKDTDEEEGGWGLKVFRGSLKEVIDKFSQPEEEVKAIAYQGVNEEELSTLMRLVEEAKEVSDTSDQDIKKLTDLYTKLESYLDPRKE